MSKSNVKGVDKYTDEGAENQPERPCNPACRYEKRVSGQMQGPDSVYPYHDGFCKRHDKDTCAACNKGDYVNG